MINRQHALRVYGPATSEHRNPQRRAAHSARCRHELQRAERASERRYDCCEGVCGGVGGVWGGACFAYFLVKRSMRPALSISFCLPV
jgi:hypothetical protein